MVPTGPRIVPTGGQPHESWRASSAWKIPTRFSGLVRYKWVDVTNTEMRAWLAIRILAGVLNVSVMKC